MAYPIINPKFEGCQLQFFNKIVLKGMKAK